MEAKTLYIKFISLKKAASSGWLEMGRLLYLMEQARIWEELNFENFSELITAEITQGGLEMDKHDASKLKNVYEYYVIGGIATMEQLEELGAQVYKFYEGIKLVKTAEDLELLRLPLTEIRKIKTQGDKGISELAACQHLKTKIWEHCLDCDAWIEHKCDEI